MFMVMPVDQLKRARRLCLSFSEATEKEAWGRIPTFRVGGSIFAMFTDNYRNDGRVALWMAAEYGVLEELVARHPDRYFAPEQTRRPGWIGVLLDQNEDAAVRRHLAEAYELVAEKARRKRSSR